jgi:hypothetical protein
LLQPEDRSDLGQADGNRLLTSGNARIGCRAACEGMAQISSLLDGFARDRPEDGAGSVAC